MDSIVILYTYDPAIYSLVVISYRGIAAESLASQESLP